MKLYSVKYDKARINSKYWEELLVEVKKIILDKKLDETNLVEKVILAIFLRIFSEMSKKGKIKCSESINPLINRIKVISSNIIHINSFMYEPLIDVSIDEIKKVSNKCLDFLSNQ
jgi:hypothetical protein